LALVWESLPKKQLVAAAVRDLVVN